VVQDAGWYGGRHLITAPLSNDLRERVVYAVETGESCRSVAARFKVAVSTVVKWSQRYRATGSVAPGKMGGHRKPVLDPHRAFTSGEQWLRRRKKRLTNQVLERMSPPRAGRLEMGDELCPGLVLRDRRIADIRRSEIHEIMDDLVASGRIGTAREVRKQMSRIFNWAADREIIESNPLSGMKRTDLARNTEAGRALTDIELRSI